MGERNDEPVTVWEPYACVREDEEEIKTTEEDIEHVIHQVSHRDRVMGKKQASVIFINKSCWSIILVSYF